eukprot:m.1218489 g.1218489  ORF g.1218489 m.1218489 type:complete len:1418 (+) comp24619_c0_seq17:472-4725(+)
MQHTTVNGSTGLKFQTILDAVHKDDETAAEKALSETESTESIIKHCDSNGWNALIWAAFANSNRVLATLLSHGADVTSVCKRGNTALHWCSHANNAAGMQLLIDANAQIDATNNLGCTPMHLAVASSRGSSVQKLLQLGASISITNNFNKTPGDVVQERPSLQSNPLLDLEVLQRGVSPTRDGSDASLSGAGHKGLTQTQYSQLDRDGMLIELTDEMARELRRESAATMAKEHARREDSDSPIPTEITTMSADGIETESEQPSRAAVLPMYDLASDSPTTQQATAPMYDLAAGSDMPSATSDVGLYESTEDVKQNPPVSITVTEESIDTDLPVWTPADSDSETDVTDAEDQGDAISWGYTGDPGDAGATAHSATANIGMHYAESRQVSQTEEKVVYASTPGSAPQARQYESIEDVQARARAQSESVAYASAAAVNSATSTPTQDGTRSLYATAMSVVDKKSTQYTVASKPHSDPTEPFVVSMTKGANGYGIKFGGPRGEAEAQQYGKGLYVAGCVPDSPADRLPDLELGMHIVAVNGHDTSDLTHVKQVRSMMTAEDSVLALTVVRDVTLWTKYRERAELRKAQKSHGGLAHGDPSPLRTATTVHAPPGRTQGQRQAPSPHKAVAEAERRAQMLELARRMDATEATASASSDGGVAGNIQGNADTAEPAGVENTDASFTVRYIDSAESGTLDHGPRKSIADVMEWMLQEMRGGAPTDRPVGTLDFTNGHATVTTAGATVLEFNTADFIAAQKHNDNFVAIEVSADVAGSQLAVVHMFHCNPRYEADSLHFHMTRCFAPAASASGSAASGDTAMGDSAMTSASSIGSGVGRDRFGSFSVPASHTLVPQPGTASSTLTAVGEDEAATPPSADGHTPTADPTDSPAEDVAAAVATTSDLRLVQRRLSMKLGQLGRSFDVTHLVTLNLTEHSGSTYEQLKELVQNYFEGSSDTGVTLRSSALNGVGTAGLRFSSDCVVTVVESDVRLKHFPSNIQWSHVYDDSAEAIMWLIQRTKSTVKPQRGSQRKWSMRQTGASARDEVVFAYCHEEPFDGSVLVEVYACAADDVSRLQQGLRLMVPSHPEAVTDPFVATSTRENAPKAFFAHQIRRGTLQATKMIGQGNFGKVYLAKRILSADEERLGVSDRCAVKILQEEDASGGKRARELHAEKKKEFLKESEVMMKLSHPNILELYGVALQQRPWLAVLEYKEYGDMHRVLRMCHAQAVELRPVESMYFCIQIASAMEHVVSKRYVHLDIAARNVLLGAQNWVKLADFGSAKEMQPGRDYWRLNVKMEISRRWMAAEAAKNKVFSERTDVWSFGVYCWEMLTNCEHPYTGVRLEDVVSHVQAGHFLELPADCDAEFAALIRSCWLLEDPFSRPTFAALHKKIRVLLMRQSSHAMRDIGILVSTREDTPALMNESV